MEDLAKEPDAFIANDSHSSSAMSARTHSGWAESPATRISRAPDVNVGCKIHEDAEGCGSIQIVPCQFIEELIDNSLVKKWIDLNAISDDLTGNTCFGASALD